MPGGMHIYIHICLYASLRHNAVVASELPIQDKFADKNPFTASLSKRYAIIATPCPRDRTFTTNIILTEDDEKIRELMDRPVNIRNMSVIAHGMHAPHICISHLKKHALTV